jgi:polyisoprenoid-binding protein YceI
MTARCSPQEPDFFDVEKFLSVHFKSSDIRIVRDRELSVEGDLTIHGVNRKVRFWVEGPTSPMKDPWGDTRIAISATTKINRKDFGLTWNAALETGRIIVGDEVTITLDVEFINA